MDASIIWENPGIALLGVLAGIFLILLLPIVSAIRRSREEQRDDIMRAREPSVYRDQYRDERPSYGSYFAGYDEERLPERWDSRDQRNDDVPSGVFGSGPRKRKSARVSVPVRSIWFLVGVCVGAGGLAAWWNLPRDPVAAVAALFDRPSPPPIADSPTRPADTKDQDRFAEQGNGVAVSSAAVGNDVGEMVNSFVTNLKAQLPMAVGPGITMVNVDSKSNVVALGFAIAQTVSEQDAPKLQKELETRFRTSVCSTPPDPSNIHGLNEHGVAFLINYVDMLGKNVAGLSVGPNYCSGPA